MGPPPEGGLYWEKCYTLEQANVLTPSEIRAARTAPAGRDELGAIDYRFCCFDFRAGGPYGDDFGLHGGQI